MPLYEYRCKECDRRFELRRAVAEADAPTSCPDGHAGTVRLLASFAAVGRASGAGSVSSYSSSSVGPPAPCGPSCACAHGGS